MNNENEETEFKSFVVKYAPKVIDDLVVPDTLKNKLKSLEAQPCNLILTGTPGCGKTTCAKVISSKAPHLFINCSSERGIDTIREKLTSYCTSASNSFFFDENDETQHRKYVILDEFDNFTQDAFLALRGVIEQFPHVVFIATCNYPDRVPAPLMSRFTHIPFNFDRKQMMIGMVRRIMHICKKEGLEVSNDTLVEMVHRLYPDFRKTLNFLQDVKASGSTTVTIDGLMTEEDTMESLYSLVTKKQSPDDLVNIYAAIKGVTDLESCLIKFGQNFIRWIKTNKPELVKFIPSIVITHADYMVKYNVCVDRVITIAALCYDYNRIFYKD